MGTHIIAVGDKQLSQAGIWVQDEFPEMFTFKMVAGNANALKDPSSILLAQSVAKSLFNDMNPLNKTVRIDNKTD
ncbi:ABC transporter permease, partial [Rhizobium leguminosarum]|uniref:ABC transporter permease n=1 Tax=Rhizobium leguminosarum TaxID=384 RepID=UPI003F996749